jgi:tetratricopeptide (TPR) repeat protein
MVFALIAGAGGRPARADVAEALVDLKAGRFLEAAAELQSVVDRSPGYAYGHFLLGHCKLKTRDIAGAEYEFRRALNLDPSRADYYLGFGLALNADGKWPFAIRAASEGLLRTSDPRLRSALLALRAYGWGALRRWSDAVDDLEALQRIRSQPWALVFLGKARFAKGDYAGAVAPLRQTLLTLSDDPVVLRLLAECFIRLAADEPDAVRKRFNYKQALAYAQQVASGLPGDLSAMQLVGRAALGAGMLEQAENVFRHVLSIDQRRCYAMADLGRTYMAEARWSEAETYLRKATVCAPRLATVYESLGDVYVALGKPEEAAAEYRRADQTGPMRGSSDLPDTVPVFAPR